jgi:creatinine amidohydrolase
LTPSRAADLSWFALRERSAEQALILPVGSFEQHGPHLPLGTDAIIAAALAEALADAVDGVVLPTLPYGAPSRPREGGGDAFPAPHLEPPTLLAAIRSAATGCLRLGARLLVILSWHMENAGVLWEGARDAGAASSDARVVLFRAPWDFIDAGALSELTGGDSEIDWPADHAGLLETGLMRHVAPELCGEPPAPVDFAPRRYEVLPTPVDAVPETGVVHDARGVTAAAGRRCFELMVEEMRRAVEREAAESNTFHQKTRASSSEP